MYRRKQTGA